MEPATIGVIADIQYRSDKDDYLLDSHGHIRSFRTALRKANDAVTAFSAPSRAIQAIVHLGDIVDGREESANRVVAVPEVLGELDDVLAALSKRASGIALHHVVGNHCLYVGRDELVRRLGLKTSAYYARDISSHWRIVVMDTMDVGVHRADSDPRRELAEHYIATRQGEPNAVRWNGGPSAEQLSWLQKELDSAMVDGMNVIVCGHHPLVTEAAGAEHVAWFRQSVLDLFRAYGHVVRCYLAGHFHSGGYAEVDGIHHITFPAVLDSDETNSYAFVQLYLDRIDVEGVGNRGPPTRSYKFQASPESNRLPARPSLIL
jgi:manganese-dependent ADP-ribose/CDP-alcohol diphosphatase